MSFYEYDLGYDQGYDTDFEPSKPSNLNHSFNSQENAVSYRMYPRRVTPPTMGGRTPVEILRRERDRSAGGSGASPAPVHPPQLAPATAAPAAPATPATTPLANPPPSAGQRRAAPHRTRPEHVVTRSPLGAALVSRGIEDEVTFRNLVPRRADETESEYLARIQSYSTDELHRRMAQGNARQWLDFYQDQGVLVSTAYSDLKARGILAPGTEVPDDYPSVPTGESLPGVRAQPPAELSRSQEDLADLRVSGLGSAEGHSRDARVSENTGRIRLTEQWIEDMHEQHGWDRDRSVGTLEHMERPLMQRGRVTDFNLHDASEVLYRMPSEEDSVLDDHHQIHRGATAIAPGSGDDASAVSAASRVERQLHGGMDQIHDDMEYLGIFPKDQTALLGAQTAFGGPLVDGEGRLLERVDRDQVRQYAERLHAQVEEVRRLDRLSRSSESEEDHERYLEARQELKRTMYADAATYYRTNLPALLSRARMNGDQVVRYMNGRGYLGDNPDLAAMSRDYFRLRAALRAADSPAGRQALHALRREIIRESQEEGYGAPSSDTAEGARAEAIRTDLRGGHYNRQQQFQLEQQRRDFSFRERMQQDTQRHEQEMARTQYQYQIELADHNQKLKMEEMAVQNQYALLQNAFGSLTQTASQVTANSINNTQQQGIQINAEGQRLAGAQVQAGQRTLELILGKLYQANRPV